MNDVASTPASTLRPSGSTGPVAIVPAAPVETAPSGVFRAATEMPTPGSLVRMDRELHRVLAIVDGRVLLSHLSTSAIYLVQEGDHGDLRLPDAAAWSDLFRTGRIEIMPGTGPADDHDAAAGDPGVAKILFQCDLLDRAGVPVGAKAMEIWLHSHWGPDLVARYGAYDSVHTLRHWRQMRRRRTPA